MTDTDLIAAEAEQFDAEFRRKSPVVWWATLLGPFVAAAMILSILVVEQGWRYVRLLLATAAATFFFFGRFVILGGEYSLIEEERRFLTPEVLVMMVLFMDLAAALLIGFHTGVLWKLPFVGGRLKLLVERGKTLVEENPRVRRATFLSIVAFVTFPLAATGSVGGSLFARLLGMSRRQTFLAVLIGSLLGCGLMYYGGSLISRYIDRSNPLTVVGGVACVAVLILVLTKRFQKLTRRRAEG